MKVIMLVILSSFLPSNTADLKLSELRKLYYQAAEERSASQSLTKALEKINQSSDPLLLCYKGAAHMMEAKYAFNPITKISRFNKGKSAIESAILKKPDQLEMRFIRFSIQTNLPTFLGYNDQIKADKVKLLENVSAIGDKVLKDNITAYLIASKQCTAEEIKKLKN